MKMLIAIALLSVASALPSPAVSNIDFRPLIVPKEVIEAAEAMNSADVKDSGVAVNFVDNAVENAEDGLAVKFVDSPINEDAKTAVNFIDTPVKAISEDRSESDEGIAVRFVDNTDDVVAVKFVDSPVEISADDAPVAVNFVDSVAEAKNLAVEEPTAVHFVDSPLNEIPQDSVIAINFVNTPSDLNAAALLIIGNIFEPIRASELEAVRVVDIPVPTGEVRYPGKTYDNPLLR